jgi:hypothetical protein
MTLHDDLIPKLPVPENLSGRGRSQAKRNAMILADLRRGQWWKLLCIARKGLGGPGQRHAQQWQENEKAWDKCPHIKPLI